MSQTQAEIAASLGLPETATKDEIDLAMAETLGDEEEVARLRAVVEAQTQLGELDATDQQKLAAIADDVRAAASAAADATVGEESAVRRPTGRLRIPDETKGRYVVLWARKPLKGADQDGRPGWQEVDVVAASGPDQAKRAVLADDAPFAAFLKASAAQKPGIMLRAVPAMHWPQDVKATTYTRPAPVLEIG